jgi:hypothetical protein
MYANLENHSTDFDAFILIDIVIQVEFYMFTYIHTYHSRFITPIAEASRIFPPNPHVLPKLFSYE